MHASGSAAEQANIVLAWDTTQIFFNALLVTGVAIVPLAMVALGWSLMRTQVVGRVSGVEAELPDDEFCWWSGFYTSINSERVVTVEVELEAVCA